MADDQNVYLDNDYRFFAALTKKDSGNRDVPDEGLTSVTGYFAATKGGAAIASTPTAMAELALLGGSYAGAIDITILAGQLSAYADTGVPIFRVIDVDGDARLTTEVLVYAVKAG